MGAYSVAAKGGREGMKERFKKVVHGEIISFIFYISFGLCLILMPTQTVNVICKVIFGLVLIGVGGYNIWQYAGEKKLVNKNKRY